MKFTEVLDSILEEKSTVISESIPKNILLDILQNSHGFSGIVNYPNSLDFDYKDCRFSYYPETRKILNLTVQRNLLDQKYNEKLEYFKNKWF